MELLVLKTKQVGPSGNAPEPHNPGSLSPAHCRSSPLSGRGFRPQTAAFRVLRCQAPRGRRSGGGLGPDYGGRVARGTGPTGQGGGARAGPAAMGNLFGRKKQSRVTEQDKAILVRYRALQAGGRGPDTPGPYGETEAGRRQAALRFSKGSGPSGRPASRPGCSLGARLGRCAVGSTWEACPGPVPSESERILSLRV